MSSSRVTPHWLKSSLSLSSSRHVAHVSSSLILFDLPFYFHLYFPVLFLFSFLMHSDLHTDLDNLDSVENNLRHSAKGATTPTTSPSPSQVMSPTTRSPTSSSTPRVPSPTLLRTWMTLRSASYSLKYTEEYADYRRPGRCVCQSVVIVRHVR